MELAWNVDRNKKLNIVQNMWRDLQLLLSETWERNLSINLVRWFIAWHNLPFFQQSYIHDVNM